MQVPQSTTSATAEPSIAQTPVAQAEETFVEDTEIEIDQDLRMFSEPTRNIAQDNSELDASIQPFGGTKLVSPEQEEEKLQEEYTNSYSFLRDSMAKATGPVQSVTGFAIDVFAEGFEDIANTGLDSAEFILQTFGNDVSFENIDYITKTLPDSEIQEAARTMIQLMAGYGGILKAAKARNIIGPQASKLRENGTKFMALLTSEGTFNNINELMFSDQMMRKFPAYNDLMEYMDEEVIGESRAKQRLRNMVFGVFETVMADKVMDMFGAVKAARKAKKAKDDQVGLVGEATEELPDIPEEGRAAFAKLQQLKKRQEKASTLRYDDAGEIKRINAASDTPPEIPDYIAFSDIASKEFVNPNYLRLTNEQGQRVYRNLTTIDSSDDFRNLVSEFFTKNQEFLGKVKFTDDMVRNIAKSYNMTPEELVSWSATKGLKLGQVLAAKSIQADAFYQLRAFGDALQSGKVSYEDYAVMYENAMFISRTVSNMETLASALLRENRIPVTPGSGTAEASARAYEIIERGQKLVDQYGPKMYKHIAKEISGLTDDAIEKLGQQSPSKVFDTLTQLRIGGMLSSPTLIIRNTLSSLSMLGTHLIETPVAAAVGGMRLGAQTITSAMMKTGAPSPARIEFAQTAVMMQGLVQGTVEATAITAGQMLRKTQALPGVRKLFPDIKEPSQFLGVRAGKHKISDQYLMDVEQAHNFWSAAKALVSLPGHAIRWQDDFTKHVAMRMKLNEEAYKIASGEVARGSTVSNAVRRAEIIEKLAIDSKTMDRLAEFGEQMTFTNEPVTQLGKDIVRLTNPKTGTLGKIMFHLAPFARANVNAITYTLDRVPLVNMLMKHNQEAFKTLKTSDPRAFDMLVAQSLTLPTMMGAAAYMLNANEMLIGARPKQDGRLFDQSGLQEFSIVTNDGTVIKYPVETPMGAMLAGIHTLNQIKDVVQGENDEYVADMASIVTMAFIHTFNPEFLASSTSTLLKALNDNDSQTLNALSTVGVDIATQHLPYSSFARRWNRSAGQGEGELQRDANAGRGLLDMFQAMMNETLAVYAPEGLPTKRDFFGETMKYPQGMGGILSPFNMTKLNSDPVMRQMVELVDGIDKPLSRKRTIESGHLRFQDSEMELFPAPSRSVIIPAVNRPVKLNNSEYEKLSLLSAGINPETGKPISEGSTYRDAMKKLFDRENFKKASLPRKQMMAADLHRTYLSKAQSLYVNKTYNSKDIRDAIKMWFEKYKD